MFEVPTRLLPLLRSLLERDCWMPPLLNCFWKKSLFKIENGEIEKIGKIIKIGNFNKLKNWENMIIERFGKIRKSENRKNWENWKYWKNLKNWGKVKIEKN
jgi:hypothetical protein